MTQTEIRVSFEKRSGPIIVVMPAVPRVGDNVQNPLRADGEPYEYRVTKVTWRWPYLNEGYVVLALTPADVYEPTS